jgi:hypothetical protein
MWVKCWGLGAYHQLGDGYAYWYTELSRECEDITLGAVRCLKHPPTSTIRLGTSAQALQMAGGKYHVCALVHEGQQVWTILIIP